MAVSEYAQRLYCKYPSCRIGSNFDYFLDDFNIKDFKTLLTEKNIDENGENLPIIFLYDELNQWAFSRDWQSLPKNVISELAFQRKNKRLILGTAQSIGQLDKQVRIQCASGNSDVVIHFLILLHLLLDLSQNLMKKAIQEKEISRFLCFFQTEELRYLYDTNKTIERLVKDKGV